MEAIKFMDKPKLTLKKKEDVMPLNYNVVNTYNDKFGIPVNLQKRIL